jgi:hypothetical protein
MLPTLAERLREQQARSRGRRPSRLPWPVPDEPPTALLFQVAGEPASPAVPAIAVASAVASLPIGSAEVEPERRPPVSGVVVTVIATAERLEPEPAEPVSPSAATERTLLAELLLLLVWAVLVVIDGALALAALLKGAARRQRRGPASALLPAAAPPFLMAAAP